MKTGISLVGMCMICILMSGCARPDNVRKINSPIDGLFYTVETSYGHGAVDSDFTRVYAHLERNGKSKKILVLSGLNLTVSNIVWTGSHQNTICLRGGITDTFRNEVTLIAGNTSETIRSHLQDQCSTIPAAASNCK
jgi:hypothetical protein